MPPRRRACGHPLVTAPSARAPRWLGHCAAAPRQHCRSSGWKAGPVLCGDFLIFNFYLNISENLYKFQKCVENTILLKNMKQISV
jgi:hypothetical protein